MFWGRDATWAFPALGGDALFEHDLFGKPVPTFPDHALAGGGVAAAEAVDMADRMRDRGIRIGPGDSEFQRKCLEKMNEVAGRGRTVLMVSHNTHAVRALCDSAITLDKGQMVYLGEVDRALQYYDKSLSCDNGAKVALDDKPRPFNRDPRVRLMTVNLAHTGVATLGAPFTVEIEAEVSTPLPLVFGIGFCSKSGTRVLTSNSDYSQCTPFNLPAGTHVISCTFPSLSLAPGEYLLDVGCCSDGFAMYDEIKEACLIEVLPPKEAPAYLLHKFSTCMIKATWHRVV